MPETTLESVRERSANLGRFGSFGVSVVAPQKEGGGGSDIYFENLTKVFPPPPGCFLALLGTAFFVVCVSLDENFSSV